ncbi:MAG TPA: hypothetical protein PLX09_02625 [Xanthomonadaceae bacterium]|nr:hypothetical protein [Xanthomonadaceae bacterium]
MLDEEAALEVLETLIDEQGEPVYRLDWDSGSPGAGSGCECVYRFADQFWVRSSCEGFEGPFETFEAALPGDFLVVTEATTAVSCTLWSAHELASRLNIMTDDPHHVLLNDEPWWVGESACKPVGADQQTAKVLDIGSHPRFEGTHSSVITADYCSDEKR